MILITKRTLMDMSLSSLETLMVQFQTTKEKGLLGQLIIHGARVQIDARKLYLLLLCLIASKTSKLLQLSSPFSKVSNLQPRSAWTPQLLTKSSSKQQRQLR
jgi:hypothetical protein